MLRYLIVPPGANPKPPAALAPYAQAMSNGKVVPPPASTQAAGSRDKKVEAITPAAASEKVGKKKRNQEKIAEVEADDQEFETLMKGPRKRRCAEVASEAVKDAQFDDFLQSDSDEESDASFVHDGESSDEESSDEGSSGSDGEGEPMTLGGARAAQTAHAREPPQSAPQFDCILKERVRFNEAKDQFDTFFKVQLCGEGEALWLPERKLEGTTVLAAWQEQEKTRRLERRAAKKAAALAELAAAERAAATNAEPRLKAISRDEEIMGMGKEEGEDEAEGCEEEAEEGEGEESDGDVYEVDSIRAKRMVRDGSGVATAEYLVRWVGYTCEDDTWEPTEHISPELIEDFEAQLALRQPAALAGKGSSLPQKLSKLKAHAKRFLS